MPGKNQPLAAPQMPHPPVMPPEPQQPIAQQPQGEPPKREFNINIEMMMADYEAQIAAKSREAMLARMETASLTDELSGIKTTLMQLQTGGARLPGAPRKRAPAGKR